MRPGHWIHCSYENYDYILKAALSADDSATKQKIIFDLLKRNKKYIQYSKQAARLNLEDLAMADALN